MTDPEDKPDAAPAKSSGSSTMAIFQLIFTILSFIATIANLPLIVLAYKQLIKKVKAS